MKLVLVVILSIFFMLLIISRNCEKFVNNPVAGIEPYEVEEPQEPEEISTKINFIYTTINGKYKMFHGDHFSNNNVNPVKIRDLLDLDYFDNGYYNYKHNYLGLLHKNKIYKYSLSRQKMEGTIDINLSKPIDCLFYLNNKIYIFKDANISIYDLDKNKIIEDIEATKIFEKIPSKINGCFLNYNDINPYSPIPFIYVLKDMVYYKYKYHNGKFKFIEKNKFKFEQKNIVIKNNKNFKINEKGLYRLICVGGGNIGGGRGGIIFNDIKLNKNDNLNIKIGKHGNRIPVKETFFSNFNLPYTGSCSGAGGTSIYKDNNLMMVAGGGGGWVSELIEAPTQCHSINYFDKKKHKSNLVFPIKKILIKSSKSRDGGYKIVVNKFEVEVKNYDEISMDIYENPSITYSELKEAKYETAMSEIGKEALIEISFNKVLSDYKIKLEYELGSGNDDKSIDSTVILFDEQNRQYVISNLNVNFGTTITSSKLFDYFSNSNMPSITSNNEFVADGNSNLNYNTLNGNKIFYLKGGAGGVGGSHGGFATSNRYNNLNTCGGGGGYKGGKGISIKSSSSDIGVPLDYTLGTGGRSFVKDLSIKNEQLIYDQFINNYNDRDGYVIINKLN